MCREKRHCLQWPLDDTGKGRKNATQLAARLCHFDNVARRSGYSYN